MDGVHVKWTSSDAERYCEENRAMLLDVEMRAPAPAAAPPAPAAAATRSTMTTTSNTG